MDNQYLWIDAADFEERGEWILDTQFSHLMGSPLFVGGDVPRRSGGRCCYHSTVERR